MLLLFSVNTYHLQCKSSFVVGFGTVAAGIKKNISNIYMFNAYILILHLIIYFITLLLLILDIYKY